MTEGRRQKAGYKFGTTDVLIKVRVHFFLIILFWLSSAPGLSAEPRKVEDPQELFDRAGRFYETGQFDDAITVYNLLLKQGLESGPLYYNLGNCYVKKGEPGKAILNYERAKRLIPSDSDLLSNERVARSLVRHSPSEPPGTWQAESMDQWFDWISIDRLTLLVSVLYWVSIASLISAIYSPTIRRWSKAPLLFFAAVFILCVFGLDRKVSLLGQEAIITARTAEARHQPFDRAPTHFILEEGTRVQILRSSKEWGKVKRKDYRAGWVKLSSMGRI